MRVDLTGRVAVVTGAGQGIGRAIARELAANGATVAVNDVSDSAEKVAGDIVGAGGNARFYAADVTNPRQIRSMVDNIESHLGPIDILINNAGINIGKSRAPLHEFCDDDWERILRVDLDGVFYCSRAVTPGMVARNRGVIVNISSVLGLVPARMQCAYVAAKAAVINLTRAQALELGSFGIRVNGVAPGSILTTQTEELFYNPATAEKAASLVSHIPLSRPGKPEDIAGGVLYLVSDAAQYVTGHVLVIDGGWTAGFSRDW